jgi:hypothetical protein
MLLSTCVREESEVGELGAPLDGEKSVGDACWEKDGVCGEKDG